jgi:hypothetical protein
MYSIFCFVKAMFPISILNESLCHISFFYLQSSVHSTCTRHPALAFLKIKEGAPVLRRFAAGLLSHRGCSTFKIKDISPSGAPPSGLRPTGLRNQNSISGVMFQHSKTIYSILIKFCRCEIIILRHFRQTCFNRIIVYIF